jgi:hypothetical protein
MSNDDPFELLRQADPCPHPMGLAAPDGIVEGTLAAGRTRRRRWRVGRLGVAVAVGATAAAAAFVSTREPVHTVSVGCYSDASLDADTAVVALDGRAPTEACAAAWQEGAVGDGPVPELQACTLPSGGIGVFPGGAPAVCQRLGHNAAPVPSSSTAGDGTTELRQALAAASKDSRCLEAEAARDLVRRQLQRLGLPDWQVQMNDPASGRTFGPDYPCATFSTDESRKTVFVVPVPPD